MEKLLGKLKLGYLEDNRFEYCCAILEIEPVEYLLAVRIYDCVLIFVIYFRSVFREVEGSDLAERSETDPSHRPDLVLR